MTEDYCKGCETPERCRWCPNNKSKDRCGFCGREISTEQSVRTGRLWKELADTKKKLDICEGALEEYKDWFNKSQKRLKIAIDALERIKNPSAWGTIYQEQEIADEALKQINQKEE
jgi:hypothetical protein